MKDSNAITGVVEGLNKLMAKSTYQKAGQEVKQNMIFAFLEGYKTALDMKSSKK